MPHALVRSCSFVAASLLAFACTTEGEAVSSSSAELTIANGVRLNGLKLNGVRLNGVRLNGTGLGGATTGAAGLNTATIAPEVLLLGVDLAGATADGVALTDAAIDAATGAAGLRTTAGATTLVGGDLAGTTWVGRLSDGNTVDLQIDGAAIVGSTWTYQVSYPTATGRELLCAPVDGYTQTAIAVPGLWNGRVGVGGGAYTPSTSQFTFACRGAAIAKCVEIGYAPWNGRAGHMAACTRLLRDDICGDGTAHTVDGTAVNLYDSLGVQRDDATWTVEAEWTPDGARCISKEKLTRLQLSPIPLDCAPARTNKRCGTFASGALMISELQ